MGILGLFRARSKTLDERMKEWISSMRSEQRHLDREIRSIERQESKVKNELVSSLQNNRNSVAKILARELVRSRKAKEQLYVAKANLNSITLQLQNQLSMYKVSQHVKISNEITFKMNQLMSVAQISDVVQSMSKEMSQAGLIQESIQEKFELMDEESGIGAEAEVEVEQVINQVLDEIDKKSSQIEQTYAVPGTETKPEKLSA